MGGKGGESPPAVQQQDNSGMMMQMMMQMFQMMGESQAPSAPDQSQTSDLEKADPVDWTKQSDELAAAAKVKADKEEADKKNRLSTAHNAGKTDDEAETTGSLLTDKPKSEDDEEETKTTG